MGMTHCGELAFAEIPGADPDCPWCEGTGLDPGAYLAHQSAPCGACLRSAFVVAERNESPPAPYWVDVTGDGWLDGVYQVPAKWIRGPLERCTAIVMHRLHRGYHDAGPRYAATTDRHVSWHFTVHRPGWERTITQHAPITRKCWHAGKANGWSLGIEHDYPGPEGYTDGQMDASQELVRALVGLVPSIKCVIAHSALYPATRSDPGPGFQWSRFGAPRPTGLGLEVVK